MGRKPAIAAPTPAPVKPSSQMGVSRTRSRPKRSGQPGAHAEIIERHVLAHEEHLFIARHLLMERLVQGFDVGEFRHPGVS